MFSSIFFHCYKTFFCGDLVQFKMLYSVLSLDWFHYI